MRGRYSIIGLEPDVIFRSDGAAAEINRTPLDNPEAFAPAGAAAAGAARADRRKPHRAAGHVAADGGRRLRLSRLRHGASDGGTLGEPPPDPIEIPDAILHAADFGGRLRRREGHHHRRHAGAAACRRQRRGRACARRRALVGDRRCARPAARQIFQGDRRRPARCRAALEHDAGETSSTWCCAPRNTSPPATFFRWCCRSASRRRSRLPPFALYRALRRVNPSPYLFFLDFGTLRGRRLEPGNPGARRDGDGHHPPDRRHAPRGRHAARRQGARAGAPRRSEGARRAPDAARSRPQRRRPRRRDRHVSRSPISSSSSATAT